MFFIFGISSGEKKLKFVQSRLCSGCGQFGRLEVVMTYMYFSLFFLPIFRWNRKYYAKSICCGRIYELNPELGKKILHGENVIIQEEELREVSQQSREHFIKRNCYNCGYATSLEYVYCPKCGNKL